MLIISKIVKDILAQRVTPARHDKNLHVKSHKRTHASPTLRDLDTV